MGQTLSEPITTKKTTTCSSHLVRVASSCMQGWRVSMEDEHTMITALGGEANTCFFGVYDGHGGNTVAQHVAQNLHRKLMLAPAYAKGDFELAIKQACLALDREMLTGSDMSGSTGVFLLLKNGKLYCGNVGDSRAIASINGEVQQLSFDHKPNNEGEAKRIAAAGGFVEFNRINGNLALSRAFGDYAYKMNDKKSPEEQMVTACPDVVVKELTTAHEFVVMACDGIWDVMSNQEVLQFVRRRISEKMELSQICEDLMSTCLAPDCQMGGLGCDNMTVVIICFLHGGTYEQLVTKCSRSPRTSFAGMR